MYRRMVLRRITLRGLFVPGSWLNYSRINDKIIHDMRVFLLAQYYSQFVQSIIIHTNQRPIQSRFICVHSIISPHFCRIPSSTTFTPPWNPCTQHPHHLETSHGPFPRCIVATLLQSQSPNNRGSFSQTPCNTSSCTDLGATMHYRLDPRTKLQQHRV